MKTLSLTEDQKSNFTTSRELYRQKTSIKNVVRQRQAGMQKTCLNIARSFASEHCSACIFCGTLVYYTQVFTQ